MEVRHLNRYLENLVSNSVAYVIKHANFELYKELFRKPDN